MNGRVRDFVLLVVGVSIIAGVMFAVIYFEDKSPGSVLRALGLERFEVFQLD
jgi:hypothetical protein